MNPRASQPLSKWGVAAAGCVAGFAWAILAWQSHSSQLPLGATLATLGIAWGALGWAMTRASAGICEPISVIGFAVGFRAIACLAAPVMEDDHYRFLWDGYRFAVTGDPYAESPQERFEDDTIPAEFRGVLDRINHPDVPTVYGPAMQWAFRLSHAIAPAQLWPWKLILLGAELSIFAMLWPMLSARGRFLLAWCPLAIFETGFNAHPDTLGIGLVVAAWWLGRRRLAVAAGAAAGLAVAAKVFAMLIVPFLLWRLGRRSWLAALAAVVALYVPFWLRGSTADLAGLRAMAGEWEFNSSVFAVVATLSSPASARAICGLIFIAIWLVLLRKWARSAEASETLPPGEWIYGAFLLLSATANPWYCLWLWPFVAARVSGTGVCALAAVSLAYVTGLNLGEPTLENFAHPPWLRPMEFAIVAIGAVWDWQKGKRPVA
jgi:alpha-1,6-mannosyltransferase